MDMITAKQAAEKWGLTPRRVQDLCKEGKIQGAERWGRSWMIPADLEYSKDGNVVDLKPKGRPIPRR